LSRVSRKINNGREMMGGRMYRATVSIKDFGEWSGIGFIANLGKALREWVLDHTKMGPKRGER
jgi:hypothetical protein